ncbi:response regulator [Paenibacillus sp. J5C_2022]|uniref:response regulator transcription factor n=1 Tax=Paenibacillus sp. J5C2022 TaxID=2977129 RepID=UPI0021D00F4D|nr:response regulator [Paenibacillus sp. J5C2022]MCU6711922.1 response regulator [Paenibacillus sp. J5C2022]
MFKVLIADDEEFILERVKNNMPWKEMDFEVIECVSNGEAALDRIRACSPDVVLTDILMPNMTGLELAQRLRSEFPEVKVALMSAYDDFHYAKEAIRFGVKGYLLKPIIRDEFLELFQSIAKDIQKEEGQIPPPFFHHEMSGSDNRNVYVARAKQYIADHYFEQIRLKDVSERLYVNANYFSSVFKRETGKNFIDYLNEVRINESKKLLLHTDHKVFEISLLVGFGNFSYYNKMFKRLCGVTPQTYREAGGLVYTCREGRE